MGTRLRTGAALRTFAGACAWGMLPAGAAVLASLGDTGRHEALFRADAAGLAVGVAVAAFATGTLGRLALRVTLAAVGLVVAHAVVAAMHGVPPAGLSGIGLLSLGTSLAALGLAAFGRRLRCPSVAAGAVAAGVLWAACEGVWWADRLAAAVPLEARTEVRQAVLDLDPFTAAANGAGYDRMRSTSLYTETIVASLPLELPAPAETAAWWAGLGVVLFAASRLVAPRVGTERPPAAPPAVMAGVSS